MKSPKITWATIIRHLFNYVFDLDADHGEFIDQSIEVSATDKVEAICKTLGLDNASPLKFLKQCREVRLDAIVGDVFEAEDTITIIKTDTHRKGSGKAKNIKNQLEEEIRLVILNTKKNEPIFLPLGEKKAISFGFWNFSNKMEIYK